MAPLSAEKTVRKISWSALKAERRLASGEVVPVGGGSASETLRVTNPEGISRFGGIGGTLVGLLSALVGFLASRGQARALVPTLLKGMFAFGAAALLGAAAGWQRAQPPELLFTLILLAVICTVVP